MHPYRGVAQSHHRSTRPPPERSDGSSQDEGVDETVGLTRGRPRRVRVWTTGNHVTSGAVTSVTWSQRPWGRRGR